MSTWSPFAKSVTKTIPFPGSETETVTIQKVGWKALEAASEESQRKSLIAARTLGPGGLLKEIQNMGGEDEVRKKAEANPLAQFDRSILLERGIKSWTLTDHKPTADEIDELDVDTANMLAREIYELSKPRTEEERKNA